MPSSRSDQKLPIDTKKFLLFLSNSALRSNTTNIVVLPQSIYVDVTGYFDEGTTGFCGDRNYNETCQWLAVIKRLFSWGSTPFLIILLWKVSN